MKSFIDVNKVIVDSVSYCSFKLPFLMLKGHQLELAWVHQLPRLLSTSPWAIPRTPPHLRYQRVALNQCIIGCLKCKCKACRLYSKTSPRARSSANEQFIRHSLPLPASWLPLFDVKPCSNMQKRLGRCRQAGSNCCYEAKSGVDCVSFSEVKVCQWVSSWHNRTVNYIVIQQHRCLSLHKAYPYPYKTVSFSEIKV